LRLLAAEVEEEGDISTPRRTKGTRVSKWPSRCVWVFNHVFQHSSALRSPNDVGNGEEA